MATQRTLKFKRERTRVLFFPLELSPFLEESLDESGCPGSATLALEFLLARGGGGVLSGISGASQRGSKQVAHRGRSGWLLLPLTSDVSNQTGGPSKGKSLVLNIPSG